MDAIVGVLPKALPTLIALLVGALVLYAANRYLYGKRTDSAVGSLARQALQLVIAALVTVMVVLSLILGHPAIRWVTIGASIFLIIFNIVGLPYESAYDNFLIVFGFVFNGLIIWYAWNWEVLA